jgi:hypothetical protein
VPLLQPVLERLQAADVGGVASVGQYSSSSLRAIAWRFSSSTSARSSAPELAAAGQGPRGHLAHPLLAQAMAGAR